MMNVTQNIFNTTDIEIHMTVESNNVCIRRVRVYVYVNIQNRLLLNVIIYYLSDLYRMFTIIRLEQIMFLWYMMLQVFSVCNIEHIYYFTP
jgi:hypothetical protein